MATGATKRSLATTGSTPRSSPNELPQIAVRLGRLLLGAVPRGLGARHAAAAGPTLRRQGGAAVLESGSSPGARSPIATTCASWAETRSCDPRRAARLVSADPATLDASTPRASVLSRLLYLNARTYLLDDLLPKMDRMTMAHGLEARSPFLDRALFEYAALLPDAYKRRGRRGKIVLKKALASRIPDAILRRRKQGFGVPLGRLVPHRPQGRGRGHSSGQPAVRQAHPACRPPPARRRAPERRA